MSLLEKKQLRQLERQRTFIEGCEKTERIYRMLNWLVDNGILDEKTAESTMEHGYDTVFIRSDPKVDTEYWKLVHEKMGELRQWMSEPLYSGKCSPEHMNTIKVYMTPKDMYDSSVMFVYERELTETDNCKIEESSTVQKETTVVCRKLLCDNK